jgi:hypothetical protein
MNVAGNWQLYPVDESMKPMIEQALGFAPSAEMAAPPLVAPRECPICSGAFEVIQPEGEMIARCSRCGALYQVQPGGGMMPVIVEAPGGGWNAEFQAIFEEKLGFKKKVRKKPIGVPE